MKRRAFFQGAAGVGLVTAGGLSTLSARSSHAAGDTVTVGINNDIVTWDPLSVSEWYTTAILPSVLETAVTNKDGAYIPWLLESIQPRETTSCGECASAGHQFQERGTARRPRAEVEPGPVRRPGRELSESRDTGAPAADEGGEHHRRPDSGAGTTRQASALVYEGLTRVYLMPRHTSRRSDGRRSGRRRSGPARGGSRSGSAAVA